MNGVINIYKEKGYSSFHAVYVIRKLTGEKKVGHTGTLDPDVTGVLPICIGKATKLVGQLTDTDKTYRCRMMFGKYTDTQDMSGQVLEEISDDEVRSRLQALAREPQQNDRGDIHDRIADSLGASGSNGIYSEVNPLLEQNGSKTAACSLGKIDRADAYSEADYFQLDNTDRMCAENSDLEDTSKIIIESMKRVIIDSILSFEGEIMQLPPMYSALKVDGVKLVNAARKGVEIAREKRAVTIYRIYDISVSDDLIFADFTVHCSKGTYVRTLCEDIGRRLNIPACMYSLERICASGLDLSTAITLDQAAEYAAAGTLEDHMIPADTFLEIYDSAVVKNDSVRKLVYGNYMYRDDITDAAFMNTAADGQIYRIYDEAGEFYALYKYSGRDDCLKCVKMFRDI